MSEEVEQVFEYACGSKVQWLLETLERELLAPLREEKTFIGDVQIFVHATHHEFETRTISIKFTRTLK